MEFGLNQPRASLEQNEFVSNKVIGRFMKNILFENPNSKKTRSCVMYKRILIFLS